MINDPSYSILSPDAAYQVSDAGVNYVQRSAQECEIRWLGDKHPEFNHAEWSQEEIARAVELVGTSKEGEVNWVEIAAKLGVCEVSFVP